MSPICAPCAAKACAVARPTPADAPVITTVSGIVMSSKLPEQASKPAHFGNFGQHPPGLIVPGVSHKGIG
jgi:hypothetical protein